jgi:polar amino acid transport system substrate-binding protein
MKKFMILLLSIVITASLFAGCSKKDTASSAQATPSAAADNSSKQEDVLTSISKNDSIAAVLPDNIKSAGKIMIGLDDSYPPMEYRDDKNNLIGFDVDLGNAIGKKLGINIEWVPTAWDGILPSLKSKKFDMILSSLSITDDRKKEIGFSAPYISGGPIIITKKDSAAGSGVDSIKGKVVGVQLGSTGETAVEATKAAKEVKKYDKITEAFLDLAAGRVDAIVADDQVGRYYMGLEDGKYTSPGKLNEEPLGIGFRQEDKALTDVVQKAIDELKADGILSKLSMKWFKTDYYAK